MTQANQFMKDFSTQLHSVLPISESFDCVSTTFLLEQQQAELIFIDGFAKDEVMEKIMEFIMKLPSEQLAVETSLATWLGQKIPYLEVTPTTDIAVATTAILSGTLVLLVEGWDECVLIDARTYPTRSMQEPEDDRVLRGSRDAFVETLIFNTALIRRRIRDPLLIHEFLQVGTRSKTDISLCYLKDKVDQQLLIRIRDKLNNTVVDSLSVSQESLAECLLPRQWYNPLPRIRYTERPDCASASILEGSLVVLTDNTPSAMILPTRFFDFFQEANDYYFPPLIGSYLKIVRLFVFFLTLFFTPLWYLALQYPQAVPEFIQFILISQPAALPVLAQLLIIEVMIDGLRLASLNTPSSLSSAFSILGAVILGEYAVSTGWFNSEVILYMAFVALSNYTQPSFELGYSFKFFRVLLLIFIGLSGWIGFVIGLILIGVMLFTTQTINGPYMAPLIPYDGKQLSSLLLRKPPEHHHPKQPK